MMPAWFDTVCNLLWYVFMEDNVCTRSSMFSINTCGTADISRLETIQKSSEYVNRTIKVRKVSEKFFIMMGLQMKLL